MKSTFLASTAVYFYSRLGISNKRALSRQPSKEKFNYRRYGGGGQGRVCIVKAGLAIGFLTTVQECQQLPLSLPNHLIRPKNSPDSVEGTHMCKSVDHHQDGTREGCQIAYAISSAASTNRRTGGSLVHTDRNAIPQKRIDPVETRTIFSSFRSVRPFNRRYR